MSCENAKGKHLSTPGATVAAALLVTAAGSILLQGASSGGEERLYSRSFLGKALPAIEAPPENWINAPTPPGPEDLEGKVVWLEFGFIACSSCQQMTPHLLRWHEELHRKGLRIIEIGNGRIDSLKRLRAEVARRKKVHPVLWDEGEAYCKNVFEVTGYPAAYLVGRDGTVVWEGLPVGRIDEIEELMTRELRKPEPSKASPEATPEKDPGKDPEKREEPEEKTTSRPVE